MSASASIVVVSTVPPVQVSLDPHLEPESSNEWIAMTCLHHLMDSCNISESASDLLLVSIDPDASIQIGDLLNWNNLKTSYFSPVQKCGLI